MKDINNKEDLSFEDEDINLENLTDQEASNEKESAENANLADDLENKFNELNDSYLRLHAEFDNYRKRTMKEKSDLMKYGGEKTIVNLLPVIDDFDRALPLIPEDAKEGVELIYNKFQSYLSQNGVKAMDVIGQPFDTEQHEAITTIPAQSEDQKDKVVDCIQKGYTLNDKVIRFAKVIVAK